MSRPFGIRVAAALAGLVLALAAPGARAEDYVVGIVAPLSGTWASVGTALRDGITLALEQAEDSGTFREGVTLSLKALDETGPPDALVGRTRKFAYDEEALLLVGPAFTAAARAIAVAANRDGVPMLSPAISPEVTAVGPWVFRSGASPARLLDGFAAHLAGIPGVNKVAVVFADDSPGFRSQAEALAQGLARRGGRIVAELSVADTEDALGMAAASLVPAQPDLVAFFLDAEPAAALAVALRKAGLAEARLAFPPAAAQPAVIRIGGAAVENALIAADYLPELPGAQNQAFVAAYRARFSAAPDRWAGIGYTTGLIAAEAIRHAGPAPTRDTVRLALERVAKLVVPLGGLTWRQDRDRNPDYAPAIFRIRGGAFVPVEPRP